MLDDSVDDESVGYGSVADQTRSEKVFILLCLQMRLGKGWVQGGAIKATNRPARLTIISQMTTQNLSMYPSCALPAPKSVFHPHQARKILNATQASLAVQVRRKPSLDLVDS